MTPTQLLADWGTEYPSPNTRDAYQRDLEDFFSWCRQREINPLEPSRVDVNAYRDELLSRGLLPQTVDRKMSSCRSFFTYALERGMVKTQAFGHVTRLALPGESTTPWLGADDLSKLLAVALECSLRDFILVALLGINGLRISEALAAQVPDVGESDGMRTLKVRRKGNKPGIVPLHSTVAAVLDTYLAGRTTGPLIARLDRSGQVATPIRRISRQAAYDRVQKLAAMAGVNPEISPHSLRHSFATLGLEERPLHVVQAAMGHASPATTLHYDRQRLNLDLNPSLTLGEGLLAGVSV